MRLCKGLCLIGIPISNNNIISSPPLNLQSLVLFKSRFKVVHTSDSLIAVLVGLNWPSE